MKANTSQQRPYQEVGAMIRDRIVQRPYRPGEGLPPEREIAERLNVKLHVGRGALVTQGMTRRGGAQCTCVEDSRGAIDGQRNRGGREGEICDG